MRQTLNLLKQRARDPQNIYKVPFQEILPLKLKNSVSGKSDSEGGVACLQEMTNLLACMKKNDFNEPMCNSEIGTFQNCHKMFIDKSFAMKKTQNKGILTPGKNLNYKQLNKFLKLYPNPN